MAYSIHIKEKAIFLRQKGYSLNEIHCNVRVSKGRLSEWLRDVRLSSKAKKRLLGKIKYGQFVSAENKKRKTESFLANCLEEAKQELRQIKINKELAQFICSLLYFCEGVKSIFSGVNFSNSDPFLVKTFLFLLRKGYVLDESKFRPCIYLHEYHNKSKQLVFWSEITNIPKKQFIKSYIKPNTGKRIRENYPGCLAIKYHDRALARQLLMTAKVFLLKYGGVV